MLKFSIIPCLVADLTLLLFSAASAGDYPFSDEELEHHPGRVVYQKICVDCHGKTSGSVGPDADAVAEYIYFSFYSPEARARNAGAHRSLSHLTVDQYRNCVADLVGNFRNNFNFQPRKRGA